MGSHPRCKGDTYFRRNLEDMSYVPPLPSSYCPDLPQGLDDVLLKALHKNRDERYENGVVLRNALRRVAPP